MLKVCNGIHPIRGETVTYSIGGTTGFAIQIYNAGTAGTRFNRNDYNVIGSGSCNGKFDCMLIKVSNELYNQINSISGLINYDNPNDLTVVFALSKDNELYLGVTTSNSVGYFIPTHKFYGYDTTNDMWTQYERITSGTMLLTKDMKIVTGQYIDDSYSLKPTIYLPLFFYNVQTSSYINKTGLTYSRSAEGFAFTFSSSSMAGVVNNSDNKDFRGSDYGFSILSKSGVDLEGIQNRITEVETNVENVVEYVNKFNSEAANLFVSR